MYRYDEVGGVFGPNEYHPPGTEGLARVIESGVEIEPYVPQPPAVPQFVSPWQAREALRRAGLLPAVNAHIEALGENHQVYIAWHYAERIGRASPLVAALAPAFNLSDADLDALFTQAATLSL